MTATFTQKEGLPMTEEAESKSALTPQKPLTARWPRHLGDWLPSWPFEDFGWFSRGDEPMAGAPIKVEEFSDQDHIAEGYRSEFRYGSFVRQVQLPKGTGPDVISAAYRDGVLEIRMPKPSGEPTKQRIQIERG